MSRKRVNPYRYSTVKAMHVLVAEKALGKPLPRGAVVHHVDENPRNNAPTNLVVCPDAAYHNLLHQRMRALDACGHVDWRKCWICKEYDAPERLLITGPKHSAHRECARKRAREQRAAAGIPARAFKNRPTHTEEETPA